MTATMDRIDIRLEAEMKQLWERAAALAGVSLSAFVKMVATERATELVAAHDTLTLSPAESVWLLDLLRQQPTEPTPAMVEAAARRRALLGE